MKLVRQVRGAYIHLRRIAFPLLSLVSKRETIPINMSQIILRTRKCDKHSSTKGRLVYFIYQICFARCRLRRISVCGSVHNGRVNALLELHFRTYSSPRLILHLIYLNFPKHKYARVIVRTIISCCC